MPNNSQPALFGTLPEKFAAFNIYHDESGTDPEHSRFQFHGALFVPQSKWHSALSSLNSARDGYAGRVHFSQLRDKSSSFRPQVARKWLELFFENLSYDCSYKCMIADTASSAFEPWRFSRPHYLYNYSAMLAVFGGIVWSLGTYDKIALDLFSEDKSRTSDDNFTTYLPWQVTKRVSEKRLKDSKCPEILQPVSPVTLVCGDPKTVVSTMKEHCEFIQLVDLITGAVAQAVNAGALQKVKIDLGVLAASWIEDTRRPPWLQDKDLHRRFSVSCFPDAQGGFYDVPLAITNRDQLSLFD
jgi:hypothetical protein